jgi:hypothetical protein
MSLLNIDLAKAVGTAIEKTLEPHLSKFGELHEIRKLLEELVAIEKRREAAAAIEMTRVTGNIGR